jgi:hypothetical protein
MPLLKRVVHLRVPWSLRNLLQRKPGEEEGEMGGNVYMFLFRGGAILVLLRYPYYVDP